MTDILVRGDDEASEFVIQQTEQAVDKVLNGEPVQYIFGKAHFYGLIVNVSPATLIPRPETAELVDLIVDKYKGKSDLRVFDIATGSGCIAVALARNLPFSQVDAIDISEKALEVAKSNNELLRTKVNFCEGDILALNQPTSPIYDIIVSNPPYIARREANEMSSVVLDHEPDIALFVPDDDPLKFYKPISKYAIDALKPGGTIYFEINPLFADDLKKFMLAQSWKSVDIVRDMQRNNRFIIATR
ncbi:MAG: peptide chain release factor N(5)-glutamine methyltransferase [Muribaculaceae bacterium]|nr:peptide chain release factor N(5)-glutamine methyltransferase [Muribaculaceae bacterium]MDE6644382.1 peptide chain release factor N(5)-glutamine methyltransferase [Muribaculaceae bacterium]